MRIVGWMLITAGLCAPIATLALTHADPHAAGAASGTNYLLSIVAAVLALIQSRKSATEQERRAVPLAGVVVLGLNLWSSYHIVQIAHADREMAAARPEIDRILQAAETEGTLLSSGQLNPRVTTAAWRPYAANANSIDLGDTKTPLRARFIELTRRAKGRELDLARERQTLARASGLATVLEPDELLRAAARYQALHGMPPYREFLDSYSERVRALQRQTETDVHALGLPEVSERELIASFNRHTDETVAAVRTFVDSERNSLNLAMRLVNYIDARVGDARLVDGNIVFNNVSLQIEYDRLRAQLGQPVAQTSH